MTLAALASNRSPLPDWVRDFMAEEQDLLEALPSGSRSAIGWIDLRRPSSISPRR